MLKSPAQLHASAQSAPAAPPISGSGALTQVSSVLALIVLLILGGAWLARRLGFAPKVTNQQALKVSASVQVGQRERVVIVDTADARLVLGVTAAQITHLHTLPPAAPDEGADGKNASPDFQQLLQNLLKRRGKSS